MVTVDPYPSHISPRQKNKIAKRIVQSGFFDRPGATVQPAVYKKIYIICTSKQKSRQRKLHYGNNGSVEL